MEKRPEKPEPLAEALVSFLVVGKLFVVGLIGIEAIWSVLLFLGFGGLFLALSYYLRSLEHPKSETLAAPNALMYRNSRSYPQHIVDKGTPMVDKCITCNKGVTPLTGSVGRVWRAAGASTKWKVLATPLQLGCRVGKPKR